MPETEGIERWNRTMSDVKVTVLPPGEAIGARDLQQWSHNRRLGRSGVSMPREKPKKDAADRWLERHARWQKKAAKQKQQ